MEGDPGRFSGARRALGDAVRRQTYPLRVRAIAAKIKTDKVDFRVLAENKWGIQYGED